MPNIAAARPVAGQPIETAWGQNVHDAIESVLVQGGKVTVSDGMGTTELTGHVVFPVAFSADPAVSLTGSDYGGTITFVCGVVPTPTVSEFYFKIKTTEGGVISGAVTAHWIAVGPS